MRADSEILREYECFIGVSAHLAALKRFVELQAAQSGPVLLIGERGLRQEQISRSLHLCGALRGQPFATVCAVKHLADRIAQRLIRGPCLIEPEALRILAQYRWEGNIVELEATLESIVAHLPPHRIDATMLPASLCRAAITFIPEEGICLPQAVADYEKSLIENALRMAGGKQNKAAKILGLRTSTLNAKLKRLAGNGRQV